MRRTTSRSPGGAPAIAATSSGARPPKAWSSATSASRHGSRTAGRPGQREGTERGQPLEAFVPGQEQLPSPGRAVGPEAGAVPGERQDRAVEGVLGHGGGGMGVVVLDGDGRDAFAQRTLRA